MKNYFNILLVCVIFWFPEALRGQQSVQVPERLSSMDEIFHDVEKALEAHKNLRRKKVSQMETFKRLYDSEIENQSLRAFYHAQYKHAEAEVLQLDYQYYADLKTFGRRAAHQALDFYGLVQQNDFGVKMANEQINQLNDNLTNVNIRLRNHDLIRKYARLNAEELQWLAMQTDFQNQLMAMWLQERKWYSDRINQIRNNQSQLSQFVDLALVIRNYAEDLIREADHEMNRIKNRVRQLRQQTLST
jgi:hypothetical protein